MGARFHLDPVGWYRSSEAAELLPAVADAVWTAREIAVRYERWDGEVERVLEPLGLVMKAGIWYLVAALAGNPRTYRLSNIKALAPGEPFERSKAFDLAAYWTEQRDRFEEGLIQGEATLRVTAKGLDQLATLSAAVGDVAKASAEAPDVDGRRRVAIPIETVENATAQLFKLGPDVEVLAPPDLRAAMADRARTLAALQA